MIALHHWRDNDRYATGVAPNGIWIVQHARPARCRPSNAAQTARNATVRPKRNRRRTGAKSAPPARNANAQTSTEGNMILGDTILETRGLTKEFKGFTAVNDVNLRVRRGSIHALIGPNGAGKTTCFNLLTKFLEPTAGQIVFNGADITRERPAQIARRGVIRSFQISAVFPHLTVMQNVRIGLQRVLGSSFKFWQSERTLNTLNDR